MGVLYCICCSAFAQPWYRGVKVPSHTCLLPSVQLLRTLVLYSGHAFRLCAAVVVYQRLRAAVEGRSVAVSYHFELLVQRIVDALLLS
jgi:hypothetical protein